MEDAQLASIIEQDFSSAIGAHTGDLSSDRALEIDYYNSAPFGNELEGESQVVSSDVFDTVEGMLPALLRIFTASDQVVAFEANGPEDEEKAKQRTEVCNYIFYRQNNGFLILYEWFKDALINKNGVVKYWWDENKATVLEKYADLSEGQMLKLQADPNVEITSLTQKPDEAEIEQRRERLAQVMQQVDARSQGLPPDAIAQMKAELTAQAASMPPPPDLYDVECRVTKDKSRVCVEAVPPEEFFISSRQRCVSIQDTEFCGHKRLMTVSALREMGCPDDILDRIGSTAERDYGEEALARDRFTDEWRNRMITQESADPGLKECWVYDCYRKIDWDEDGVSELRHIIKVENSIWINEECDHIGYAALTPIIMPHRWLGKSAAELVMSDQFIKSSIWRQMLNNLYLTNNPRKAVLSSPSGVVQANLDDLMTTRAGGIVREYVPNAVRNEEIPFVAGASFPMLEYIDSQKEVRTGQTRYSQGTDSDSLNKTAHGIQLIQQAGQQRGDLIARIFAETGVKDLMRGIAYMASKYSTKPMTVKLRNKWEEIDPREWTEQYDMTINVGLGTGNKDVQLAHLDRIGQSQAELMAAGRGYLVSDENIYNVYTKRAEAMGYKHPELFISDPKNVQKPPPQPNPEMVKIQMEAQADQAKIQSNEKLRAFDAQTQKELAQISSNTTVTVAHINGEAKKEIEKMRISADAQNTLFNARQQEGLKHLEHQHSQLTSDSALQCSTAQAETQFAIKQAQDAAKAKQDREQSEAELRQRMIEAEAELQVTRLNNKDKLENDTKIAIIQGLLDAMKPQPSAGADGKPGKTPAPNISAMLKAVSKVLNNDFETLETEPEADDKYDKVIEMLQQMSERDQAKKKARFSRSEDGSIIAETIQ